MGKKIIVDLCDKTVSRLMFLEKRWEPDETAFICSVLKNGMVFVDIGANLGYFSVIASDLVGAGGQVIAFEPDSTNVDLLKKNIKLNGCNNVTIVQAAVASTNKKIPLFVSGPYYCDHRIYQTKENNFSRNAEGRPSVAVDAVALDEYFSKHTSKVDVIKMDIQGAEYEALQGMKKILNQNPNIILMTEFWPHGLRQAGIRPSLFLQELEELGFKAYILNNGQPELAKESEILASTEEAVYMNLVFSRNVIS